MEVSALFKKAKNFFFSQNDTFWLFLLFTVSFLGASITIFGGDLSGRNLSTPFFYSSFVLVFAWFSFKLFFTIRHRNFSKLKVIIILGAAIVIGMFNILIQTPFSHYSFNYFKKIIITFTVLLLIFLFSFGNFHAVIKKAIPLIALVLSTEIAVSFFLGIGQIYANQTSKNLLYFTFGNSNAAGIYFALLIMMSFYGVFSFKRIYFKFVFILFIAFLSFLLFKTKARNAFYGIVLSLIVLFILKLNTIRDNKIFDFVVLAISCSLPIIIICLYTSLATKTNVLNTINYLLATPGKTTTSRINTWVSAFKHLKGIHFLIGDYYNSTTLAYSLFHTIPGYQNSQIDYFVDEGFVPALLILSFIFLCIFNRFKNINKNKFANFLPITLWLFTLFSSMFEAGLFICMNVWYVFGFSFISLGCFSNEGTLAKDARLFYYQMKI